jgi:hypothetical protein
MTENDTSQTDHQPDPRFPQTILDEKYVALVESCQKQVALAWKAYGTVTAICFAVVTLLFSAGGFIYKGSLSDMMEGMERDFRKSEANFEKFKQDLEKTARQRIDAEIQTRRIQSIISTSVSNDVSKAVQQGLTEEARVASRQEARKITQDEIKPLLADLREKQQLLELIILAEDGDMKAFRRLEELAGITVWQMGPPSPKSSYRYKAIARSVTARLCQEVNQSHTSESAYMFFNDSFNDEQIKRFLRSADSRDRIVAAHTIAHRNMTDQIPALLSMLSDDENLYVREAVTRVLNKFLFNKYTMPQHAVQVFKPDAVEVFTKKYEETKDGNQKKTKE